MKKIRFVQTLFTILLFSDLLAQEKDISWYTSHAPFRMPAVTVPQFPDKNYNITDYGAKSGGEQLNTTAFEKAIAACAASGGGKVIVPAGLWLTGPIQLKSNINLEVKTGAIVLFTKDHSQYPIIKASNSSSSFVPASPIYGYDLKNIAITGNGIIDGAGESWRPVKKTKTTAEQWKKLLQTGVLSKDSLIWWPSAEALDGENIVKKIKDQATKPAAADYLPARDFLRPYMVYLVNCENILIENITLRNSPKFIFYPTRCKNITITGATFFNEWWAQNGDAIDISACENVVIYKTKVSAGDDGICMKSSRGKSDTDSSFNLQNILIAGCTVLHGHGGFVIGSNTDGGMKNIYVTDCNFIGTDIGIRVKSNAGRGGVVKDIFISNISMCDIINEAISFDTYYDDVPAGKTKDSVAVTIRDKTPEFKDFHISDIQCYGAKTAIAINGLAEMPIHDIHFENITITSDKGFVAANARNLSLQSVKINSPAETIYQLNSVNNFQLTKGYFPELNKYLIKKKKKSSGIKVAETDLRNVANAVQVLKK